MSSREVLRTFRPKVHKHEYEGQAFHVRALSGAGRSKLLSIVNDDKNQLAKIVTLGLCEEDGSLSFNVDNEKDIAEIQEIDGSVLQSIAFKIYEISGLSVKEIEKAEKNS